MGCISGRSPSLDTELLRAQFGKGPSVTDQRHRFAFSHLVGPDYATAEMRLTRRFLLGDKVKLEFMAESFNLLNRDNQRVQITQDGFITKSAQFVQTSKLIGINYFPAQYRTPTSFLRATDDDAPPQVQLGLKLIY